ncbi:MULTISPECIES: hypothetical protein [Proteiniclasticum]|uniref:Uncharacterized protein n=1 Tax=Proteiniclasticum ruminis TaxID=398199 RepID=A0A1G8NNN8_9CLOT|nr:MULTISPECIES: hypothetical protein [Proteiniclasticum]MBP9920685.1 hypothetical protein [Proteiniclasticum sp.]SDI81911.1 hypothetical protein SAMN05421804_104259 [Proteiniclasticum ruminis]SFN28966.1 hypothetical protein SAMN04488695_101163 [Proteiniclasticum ruminis]
MKVLAKPIEMIAWFDFKGRIHPIRFRLIDEDGKYQVISIKSIQERKKEKLAGNLMQVFLCRGNVQDKEVLFELKYEKDTDQWTLFKM